MDPVPGPGFYLGQENRGGIEGTQQPAVGSSFMFRSKTNKGSYVRATKNPSPG